MLIFFQQQQQQKKEQANKIETQALERARVNVCRLSGGLWQALISFFEVKSNINPNRKKPLTKKKLFSLLINMLQDHWLSSNLCHFNLSSHEVND